MPISNPDETLTEFTKHTLYVSGGVFLSYIAARLFPTSTSDTRASTMPPVVVVPWRHGAGTRAPDDGAESIRTKPCSVESM